MSIIEMIKLHFPNNGQQVAIIKLGPKLISIGMKIAKGAKVTKVGLFAASAASYAWLYTWQFSLIILFALVVHESGHVWAMRWTGIPTKGFYLIPFIGGAAVPERGFKDRGEEYFVAIAGPAFGLVSAAIPLLLDWITGYALFGAVAAFIATINLFNLLPITPLDGGRITKSITFSASKKVGLTGVLLGLVSCGILLALSGAWILGFILVVGCFDLAFEWGQRNQNIDPMRSPLRAIGLYFSVCFLFLSIVLAGSHSPEGQLALDALRD